MNPAQRLLGLLDRLVALPDPHPGEPIGHAWARVLEIETTDEGEREDQVVTCLQALRAEIAATSKALVAMGCTSEMLHPSFGRLSDVASPSRINTEWRGYRGNLLSPEVRLPLLWAAWAMPKEEGDIDQSSRDALLADIAALERSAVVAGVSPFIAELARRQSVALRAALRLYGIRGVAAMDDAIQSVAGMAATSSGIAVAEVQAGTEETASTWARTKKTFQHFVQVAKRTTEVAESTQKKVETVKRMYASGKDVYELAESVWDKLPPLLGP